MQPAVWLVGWAGQLVGGQIVDLRGGDARVHIGDLAVPGVNEIAGIDGGKAREDRRGLFTIGALARERVDHGEVARGARHVARLVRPDRPGPRRAEMNVVEIPGLAAVEGEALLAAVAGDEDQVLGILLVGIDGAAVAAFELVGPFDIPDILAVDRRVLAVGAHREERAERR